MRLPSPGRAGVDENDGDGIGAADVKEDVLVRLLDIE